MLFLKVLRIGIALIADYYASRLHEVKTFPENAQYYFKSPFIVIFDLLILAIQRE